MQFKGLKIRYLNLTAKLQSLFVSAKTPQFYKDHIFDHHSLNKNLTDLIVYLCDGHRVLKVLTSLLDYDLSLMIA